MGAGWLRVTKPRRCVTVCMKLVVAVPFQLATGYAPAIDESPNGDTLLIHALPSSRISVEDVRKRSSQLLTLQFARVGW